MNAQPVDLNDVITQARRDVGSEFAGHPVRWQVGQLPVVRGDRAMLQQVMTNLLSNAVKYSGKRELSAVKVWSEETPLEWRASVQDNGVGFDPQYAQKLFGFFQRLHTEREFQGTGVGLATVRRIVLKYGGQVFAESLDDSRATFSFTLPKAPAPSVSGPDRS
ncbi:sensor histidine kinase [Deinococcus sp. UYEF24]